MYSTQDTTTFIDHIIARDSYNFPKVLNEVAKGFKKHGFFSKPDWSQILIGNFTGEENVDDIKIDICDSTRNEYSLFVLLIDGDDTQPKATEMNLDDTQLLVRSTPNVLQHLHANDVKTESNAVTSYDDDDENLLVPLRFRTPSPIEFVTINENVIIKVESESDTDTEENSVKYRKDYEIARHGKLQFLKNLKCVDWTQICSKVIREQSAVKFVSTFDSFQNTKMSPSIQNEKWKFPKRSIAATKQPVERIRRKTHGRIENNSSSNDLLTTVSSSSSNTVCKSSSLGIVAAQRNSTEGKCVVSPSSMNSDCEYYENPSADIAENMEIDSQESPMATASHLTKEDLPANLMCCKVEIVRLNLDNYGIQIGNRKNVINKKVQLKSSVHNPSGASKTAAVQNRKNVLKNVQYPEADDDMGDKMQQEENSDNKRFSCDICGKKFSSKHLIRQHMICHSGEKPHACRVCKRSFGSRSNLKRHLERHLTIHTGEKPFVCHVCSKSFNRQSSLSRHKLIHTGEKPFVCHVCSKSFNHQSSLSRHKLIHTGEKPFVCDVCSKAFNQQSNLSHHKLIHTGEKPFVCDVCSKAFNRQSHLSQHQIIHTGEKPFVCDVCSKAFNQQSNLSQHKMMHTGEKPFVCDVCSKAFNQQSTLSRHKKIHSGVKAFFCARCGKSFVHKSDLKHHLVKCIKKHPSRYYFKDHSKQPSS